MPIGAHAVGKYNMKGQPAMLYLFLNVKALAGCNKLGSYWPAQDSPLHHHSVSPSENYYRAFYYGGKASAELQYLPDDDQISDGSGIHTCAFNAAMCQFW